MKNKTLVNVSLNKMTEYKKDGITFPLVYWNLYNGVSMAIKTYVSVKYLSGKITLLIKLKVTIYVLTEGLINIKAKKIVLKHFPLMLSLWLGFNICNMWVSLLWNLLERVLCGSNSDWQREYILKCQSDNKAFLNC